MIEYTGERISRRETSIRGQGDLTYIFTLDEYWTCHRAVGGSKRLIKTGEELKVDYCFSSKIERVPCRCGVMTCRVVINVKE